MYNERFINYSKRGRRSTRRIRLDQRESRRSDRIGSGFPIRMQSNYSISDRRVVFYHRATIRLIKRWFVISRVTLMAKYREYIRRIWTIHTTRETLVALSPPDGFRLGKHTDIPNTVWLVGLTDYLETSITGLSREVRSRAVRTCDVHVCVRSVCINLCSCTSSASLRPHLIGLSVRSLCPVLYRTLSDSPVAASEIIRSRVRFHSAIRIKTRNM